MTKYVYFFGGGHAEGSSLMRNLLGGKGCELAEMTNLGIPVPPGFTVTTQAWAHYNRSAHEWPDELWDQPLEVLERLVPQLVGPLVRGPVVVGPGLRRHRESRRDRDPEVRHLRQLAPLAAQQVPHEGGALGVPTPEEVDVFRHRRGSPSPMTKKPCDISG